MPKRSQEAARRIHLSEQLSSGFDQRIVRDALSKLLSDPALAGVEASTPHEQRIAGRRALERAVPDAIRSMSECSEMILSGGRESEAVVALLPQAGASHTVSPLRLPWSQWWPVIRLWGGLLVLMGAATMGLAWDRTLRPYQPR